MSFNRTIQSLADCCRSFVLMHLEEFPESHLSLLPLSERKLLLQRLPIADVCLLEDTNFMKGLDMEAYWRLPMELAEVDDGDNFIKEWGETKFTKAALYGEVASVIIGCPPKGFWYPFPSGNQLVRTEDMIEFLYAVRRFPSTAYKYAPNKGAEFNIPSRYQDKANLFEMDDLIDAAVNCFGGELPKILTGVIVDNDFSLEHTYFLRKLRFLSVMGVEWWRSTVSSMEFVQAVVKVATDLEVLNLYGDDYDGCTCPEVKERVSLDGLCSYLATHPTFWSKFRLLQIFTCSAGYTVSEKQFNELISAFLSTPTDHVQKVKFTDAKIVAYDLHPSPKFDRSYAHLKTIELVNCMFVSKFDASPDAISRWLGESIDVLESTEPKACSFQVSTSSNSDRLSKKRKYPEMEESVDNDSSH